MFLFSTWTFRITSKILNVYLKILLFFWPFWHFLGLFHTSVDSQILLESLPHFDLGATSNMTQRTTSRNLLLVFLFVLKFMNSQLRYLHLDPILFSYFSSLCHILFVLEHQSSELRFSEHQLHCALQDVNLFEEKHHIKLF